jgi:hypothetical protein
MSKAAIGKALDSSNLDHVRNYLQRVHNIDVVAKGKRKRPSKQQLGDSIYGMKNVSTVLVDLQRMKELKPSQKLKKNAEEDDEDKDVIAKAIGIARTFQSMGKDLESTLPNAEEDEEDKEDEEDEEEDDNVMDMLKGELALRGKTTNGKSYPQLVLRLISSLRDA